MAQENYVAPSIQASSATFADLQAGGLTNVLNKVIAANPAIADPTTAPTVAVTGGGTTGGNLPAGTYFLSYTWIDGAGETLAKETAASFTIAAGNIPQATIPSLPTGACAANIYLTAAGGASGTETLYATGIAATTFNLSFAAPSEAGVLPPTVNTTGAASIAARLTAGGTGRLELLWTRLSDLVSQYVGGQPVSFQAQRINIRHLDYCFALWKQVTNEVLTLISGQAQSLHYRSTLVQAQQYRSFP